MRQNISFQRTGATFLHNYTFESCHIFMSLHNDKIIIINSADEYIQHTGH